MTHVTTATADGIKEFKETRDIQHDDEMHCGCLDYCEWVLNGKPEEALQN